VAELPCGLYLNVVQQEVQQRGRTTARMHDREEHGLAAEIGESSHAPVVRIERISRRRIRAVSVPERAENFDRQRSLMDIANSFLLGIDWLTRCVKHTSKPKFTWR